MGKEFGSLYYIRNIVYHRISPYEQKALGQDFFKTSLINLFNDFRRHAPVALPPLAIAYLGIKWGMAERERSIRKDPSIYVDLEED